ncbi:MAG: zinc ABC transporter substrate-binding protein [bacterium]
MENESPPLRRIESSSIPLPISRWSSNFQIVRSFLLVAAVWFVSAVGSSQAALNVVCTTGMVADMVRQVAGERANVTALIADGVDPHLYKPTRDDVAKLLKADVIFYSGLHLEGRMEATFDKMSQHGKCVTAVTSTIPEDLLLRQAGAEDPHVWMDPLVWAGCIEAVERTLAQADPGGATGFHENGKSYKSSLEAVSSWILSATATIPPEKKVLITAHDAFQYYGRATGLQVLGLQGLSTESEAGVSDINRIVDEIVKRQIPAVFFESTLSEKNIRAVIEGAAARGQSVKTGGMLYSDSLGAAGTPEATCVGMLQANTRTITNALGGHAP